MNPLNRITGKKMSGKKMFLPPCFCLILALLSLPFATGCGTLWGHVITVTEVRDSAMRELAALSAQGRISPATDAKITQADDAYRTAAEITARALVAYKAGTSQPGDYAASLKAVKDAVSAILDILAPLVMPSEGAGFRTRLEKASQL